MHDEEVCTGKRRAKKRQTKRADHKHEWVQCCVYFADDVFKYQKYKYCKICGTFKMTGYAALHEGRYVRMVETLREMQEYYPDLDIYVSDMSSEAFNKLEKFPFA